MKKMILAVLLFVIFSTQAQAEDYRGQIIVGPSGTTRIQYGANGNNTFYNNNGYYGRSFNTGGGSYSLYNRDGIYMGRTSRYGSGYRYVPAPHINHLHSMPHPIHHR